MDDPKSLPDEIALCIRGKEPKPLQVLPSRKLCHGIDGVGAVALSTHSFRYHQRAQQAVFTEGDHADKGEWLIVPMLKCEILRAIRLQIADGQSGSRERGLEGSECAASSLDRREGHARARAALGVQQATISASGAQISGAPLQQSSIR